MVKKAEGTDRAFFWGPDFSTQGYMKWTLYAVTYKCMTKKADLICFTML